MNSVNGVHLVDPWYLIQTCISNDCEINRGKIRGFKSAKEVDFWYWQNPDVSSRVLAYSMRAGTHSCTISKTNNSDKWSREYRNCTAIVAIGKSRETGENISFLTHQDPHFFLSRKPYESLNMTRSEYFSRKLKWAMERLLLLSEEGSVDVIILWGRTEWYNTEEYEESIFYLDAVIAPLIGVSPAIIAGPTFTAKTWDSDKAVYVDTKRRRVYFFRKYHETESLSHWTSANVKELLEKITIPETKKMQVPIIPDSFLDRTVERFLRILGRKV